jgi:hypothetical protein
MHTHARTPILVMALIVALSWVVSLPEAEAQLTDVFPLVDCTVFNAETNELTIAWGYRNDNPFHQSIPVGLLNFFSPGGNRDQPTFFLTGEHHFVFSTTVPASLPSLTWNLLIHQAVATNDPRLNCGSVPVPGTMIWQGAWDAATSYDEDDVVTSHGSIWRAAQASTGVSPGQGTAWEVVVRRSVRPTSQVHTLSPSGTVTITDTSVTPDSVIVLQYVVDGSKTPVLRELTATNITNGRFTAVGTPRRTFRYIVFN